jgi:Tol biopolymer transport system component/uncharacterized protein YraI
MSSPMSAWFQIRFGSALGLLLIVAVLFGSALPGYAQTSDPTPVAISAVVRASGATIYNGESRESNATHTPGTRLTATARSDDGAWLQVQGEAGSGWAQRAHLLTFNEATLPVVAISIVPVEPTPTTAPADEPAATATPAAGRSATATPVAAAANNVVTAATPEGAGSTVTVKNVSLNVRSGPGTGYAVIGKAAAGQTLTVQGRNAAGDWLQIRLPGSERVGWVSAAYVNAGDGLAEVDVVEAPPAASTPTSAAGVSTASPVTATQATATPAAVQASPVSGLTGKLVIQTVFGGPIYIYEFATGSLRQLTTGYDPALSPDGTQVAFTRAGGEHGLYVINVDGTGERKVFGERQGFFSPKWSPNGKWILFVRSDSFWKCKDYSERIGRYHCEQDRPGDGDLPYMIEIRPRLARVDLNGENYQDLATLDTATAPDWNSAGIVYSSEGGIQRTTVENNGPSTLVHFDVRQQYYADPDWQPGGGRIVLQQRRPSHWELFIVNPDGSGYAPLTRPTTVLVDSLPSNVAPAWSPDGQHIVFLSNRTPENSAGAWGVWVMNADGSNQRRLPIDLPFEYSFVEEQMLDWGP